MELTPFKLPQTNNTPTTNILLDSAPIMCSNIYTNPANPRNSIPVSLSDPLIGLTQDEAIIRNIIKEYNDRSQVLTSTAEAVPPQNAQVRNPQPQATLIENVENIMSYMQSFAFSRGTNTQLQPSMPDRITSVSSIPSTYTPLPTVPNSLPYTHNTISGHQNTLPTTLTTPTTTDSQLNLQYVSPEDPRLGNVFYQ